MTNKVKLAVIMFATVLAVGHQMAEANSHKQPCPPGNELLCLNGGVCFTIEVNGFVHKSCNCAEGYSGSRCQFRSLDLDILFGRGPEKDFDERTGDSDDTTGDSASSRAHLAHGHETECPAGDEYYCLNGATCTLTFNAGPDGFNAKTCMCSPEFTGKRCQYLRSPHDTPFHQVLVDHHIAEANSHKQPCPPGNENLCLNGGVCFIIEINEVVHKSCNCAEGYMGSRCQFRSIDLDILFERGPEKAEATSKFEE